MEEEKFIEAALCAGFDGRLTPYRNNSKKAQVISKLYFKRIGDEKEILDIGRDRERENRSKEIHIGGNLVLVVEYRTINHKNGISSS